MSNGTVFERAVGGSLLKGKPNRPTTGAGGPRDRPLPLLPPVGFGCYKYMGGQEKHLTPLTLSHFTLTLTHLLSILFQAFSNKF